MDTTYRLLGFRVLGFWGLGFRGLGYRLDTAPTQSQLDNTYNMVIYSP